MIETWRQVVNSMALKSSEGAAYYLIGPLRGGGYLKSLTLVATSSSTDGVGYGFALTGSSQANAGSYASGAALIQRSTEANINGKPAIVQWHALSSPIQFTMPLWVSVGVGSMYVVGLLNREAAGTSRVFVAIEVVGVRES